MSDTREFDVVTGAFGFTGKYICRQLLQSGRRVRTITGHPNSGHDFGNQVQIAPLNFRDYAGLVQSLRGASVLYNTYWVRFNHGGATFKEAVGNSLVLIQAAKEAGVRRIVHLSIANPSLDSCLPYYSGKALVEKVIMDSSLSYAILRPTVVFGREDILINNIAWFARHFPVFTIPGSGQYQLQPIFVEDLAELAVQNAKQEGNFVSDAAGPETYPFEDFVRQIAFGINANPKFIHASPWVVLRLLRLLGLFVRDIVLTAEEMEGLMTNLLVSKQPALGRRKFSAWLARNAADLGVTYASELRRHYR